MGTPVRTAAIRSWAVFNAVFMPCSSSALVIPDSIGCRAAWQLCSTRSSTVGGIRPFCKSCLAALLHQVEHGGGHPAVLQERANLVERGSHSVGGIHPLAEHIRLDL